jgi:hypothetical protein
MTQPFNWYLMGLASHTTYYFQMVFYDTVTNQYQYGAIKSFTTKTPTVTTKAATSITASGAALNGTINPQGAPGYAGFYWGTDPSMGTYNSTCICLLVTANSLTQPFTAPLMGLANNTTYYFQMVFYDWVTNQYQYGAIKSFTTKTPTVKTKAATSITASGAALNGTINPEGDAGYAGFYWGTDPSMKTYNISCICLLVTANFTTQPFTAPLMDLANNTTYYFQMVFYDTFNNQYQYGAINSFTTKTPSVTTQAATSITTNGAALNGAINPQGDAGYAGFYWGTDPTMGTYNSCICLQVTANFTTQLFDLPLTGLTSNTTYYFQMVFEDTEANQYQYGTIKSFTTK